MTDASWFYSFDELENVPRWRVRLLALESEREKRHQQLLADPLFEELSESLKQRLKDAYVWNPEVVRKFFRAFSWPTAPMLKRIHEFLSHVKSLTMHACFEDYVDYANRFRVRFLLRENPLSFELVEGLPGASTFHGKIENAQLVPAYALAESKTSTVWDAVDSEKSCGRRIKRVRVKDCPAVADDDYPIDQTFASGKVEVLHELAEAIKQDHANLVQIDDTDGSSVLSTVESLAYSPEKITVVQHNAEQRYTFLLVGEKVPGALRRKLDAVITEINREVGRGNPGRRVDLVKRRKIREGLKQGVNQTKIALELDGEESNRLTGQDLAKRLAKNLSKISRLKNDGKPKRKYQRKNK